MTEAEGPGSLDERAYRRRFRDKGNKREDWAVDALREALASLADPDRVDRLLFDLGRYYNPLADAPIVDMPTRRQVGQLLRAGETAAARDLLAACLDRYRGGIDDGLGPSAADR